MGPTRALLMMLAAATPLAAQAPSSHDAWVLPPGMVRVGVGLDYSHFDSRFGAEGTEPLASDLLQPLDASRFAPLATLRGRVEAFIAATGGGISVAPANLSLGSLDAALSADVRSVPMELGLGILPRVALEVTVPIYRSELQVSRFGLSGGTVGANPDPDGNAAAFGMLGSEFESLGRSPLLPLAGSELGQELARRVAAAGGDLSLPRSPADAALLQALLASEFGVAPLETELTPWRTGDARVAVRVLTLTSIGAAAFPPHSGSVHYRATVAAGVRLPTGAGSGAVRLVSSEPPVGLSGWSVSVAGDLFLRSVAWINAGASYSATGAAEVAGRLVAPAEPFASVEPPALLRWSPPSELSVRVSPRLRLEEAIAVGLEYEALRLGESSFGAAANGGSSLDVPGGTVQRLGLSVRFSTLPAHERGAAVLPADVTLSYAADVTGPARAPAGSRLTVQGRAYHRLWGR